VFWPQWSAGWLATRRRITALGARLCRSRRRRSSPPPLPSS
jgi:hypothetical protein